MLKNPVIERDTQVFALENEQFDLTLFLTHLMSHLFYSLNELLVIIQTCANQWHSPRLARMGLAHRIGQQLTQN